MEKNIRTTTKTKCPLIEPIWVWHMTVWKSTGVESVKWRNSESTFGVNQTRRVRNDYQSTSEHGSNLYFNPPEETERGKVRGREWEVVETWWRHRNINMRKNIRLNRSNERLYQKGFRFSNWCKTDNEFWVVTKGPWKSYLRIEESLDMFHVENDGDREGPWIWGIYDLQNTKGFTESKGFEDTNP